MIEGGLLVESGLLLWPSGMAFHPPSPEADSGIRSMSGWYASYWNAFLLHGSFHSAA